MADDILQQLPGQAAEPVLAVSQGRLGIGRVRKVVTPSAFHVDWRAAEVPFVDQLPHPSAAGVNRAL